MRIRVITSILCILAIVQFAVLSDAATFKTLGKPPLDLQQFGIYSGKDRVGFYSQKITEIADGYRIDTKGSVDIQVMGFTKKSTSEETYVVDKNLVLRSFDISHTLNGVFSRLSGKKYETSLLVKIEEAGKTREKSIRFFDDVIPGPVLNVYPLMHDHFVNKSFKTYTFDTEELRIEEVTIAVYDEGNAPSGKSGLKMSNTLYPFVKNDIWVDADGKTLWESVRDGLVITKPENP